MEMEFKELSFKGLDLKFFFVLKDGLEDTENLSSDMNSAFAHIRDYVDCKKTVDWKKEEEVIEFSKIDLTKQFVFVLENFEGRAFEFLQTTKALIIGPRCLISCLIDNSSIPLGASPIFTIAMRNLIVCTSALPPLVKPRIRKLVQWMGGYFSDDLRDNCTHLVSNTVKSKKYEEAASNNIQIMHSDWVDDVWIRSKTTDIHGTSKEFEKYKLPIFYSLRFTSSSLLPEKRNEIIKLVIENGGHYDGSFKRNHTDILIIEKHKINTPKYNAAIRNKTDCILPDWVTDSVLKGYALSTDNYKVVGLTVSTPTKLEKGASAIDFNPDCTQLSEITRLESVRSNSTINETVPVNASRVSVKPVSSQRKSYKDCLAGISTQLAKKSGPFLDGCCIYLAGFTGDEKEKLNKILNVGSAIRYDEINEKITHCIVGDPTTNEMNKLNEHGITILKLEWLAETIKQKMPVLEENFIYRTKIVNDNVPEFPSPSSKKTIQSMNHSFKKPILSKTRLDFNRASTSHQTDQFEKEQNEFLAQYTQQNVTALPPKPLSDLPHTMLEDSILDSDTCTEDYLLNFFIGHTVHIHDEEFQQLVVCCENAGAKLVDKTYKDEVDYVIVPSTEAIDLQTIIVNAKHVVNEFWIDDAIKKNQIIDIEYYHEPIPFTAISKPLNGIIIVISTYTEFERNFIEQLAKILGATTCNTYAKKQRPILICPSPEGAKYNAALKWNYPVVKSGWLVECSKQGEMVSLEPYLIGDATLSISGQWSKSKSSSGASSEDASKSLNKSNSMKAVEKELKDDHDENQLDGDVLLPRKSVTESSDIRSPEKTNFDQNSNSTPDVSCLRHRRISELADIGRRNFKGNIPVSPITPHSPGPLNVTEFVKDFSPPYRETIYNVLKEEQSKGNARRKPTLCVTPGGTIKAPSTPTIPDFVTTPEIRKRQLAFLDTYYMSPPKNRRPSTPYSEIRKRFWRDVLGDKYVEEGYYNTQTSSQVEDVAVPSTSAGITIPTSDTCDTENLADTNIGVKRISDYIRNNRETENEKKPNHIEIESEIIPQNYESEGIRETEGMVGWRDPSEFSSDAKLKVYGMQFSGTPRFSISCTNDELKQQTIEKIKQLKGEICENLITFDNTCTHIVCERPNRGEKILSCIASGKWILQLNYIVDSLEAGYFLDEELYEWGNPKALNPPNISLNEASIANAAFRWRTANPTGDNASGAFKGFRVILHISKKEQFEKLITAGGGTVINIDGSYRDSEEALRATHCLVDSKGRKLKPSDHKALLDAKVMVLTIHYLIAHLNDDPPDYSKYKLSL